MHVEMILRLVFYVAAAALIAGAFLWRPDAGADTSDPNDNGSGLREVSGETSEQGELILRFDADDVLRSWDVLLEGTCYGGAGAVDGVRWYPSDNGAPARVVRHGDVVDAVEVRHSDGAMGRSTLRVRLHARVTADRATGTFHYARRREGGPRDQRVCSSLPIRFSLPVH
jgi:hypothetical protein